VQRELRNGDLVLIHERYLQTGPKGKGVTGIIVDDIDAHEEVKLYHPAMSKSYSWWRIECLTLLNM
jgi:hypothetical protein